MSSITAISPLLSLQAGSAAAASSERNARNPDKNIDRLPQDLWRDQVSPYLSNGDFAAMRMANREMRSLLRLEDLLELRFTERSLVNRGELSLFSSRFLALKQLSFINCISLDNRAIQDLGQSLLLWERLEGFQLISSNDVSIVGLRSILAQASHMACLRNFEVIDCSLLKTQAMVEIGHAFSGSFTTIHLDCSQCFFNTHLFHDWEVAEAISAFSVCRVGSISLNKSYSLTPAILLKLIAQFPKWPTVKRVDFGGTKLLDRTTSTLFFSALRMMKQLKYCDFGQIESGEEKSFSQLLAAEIVHFPRLEAFRFDSMGPKSNLGVDTLLRSLAHCPRLADLNFLPIHLTNSPASTKIIIDQLERWPLLKELIFRKEASLTDLLALTLAEKLPNCTNLKDLSIESDMLTDVGAIALIQAVKLASELKIFGLFGTYINPWNIDTVLTELRLSRPRLRIQALFLKSLIIDHPVNFSDSLAYLIVQRMPPLLRSVKIHSNFITDAGAIALIQAVKRARLRGRFEIKGALLTRGGIQTALDELRLARPHIEIIASFQEPDEPNAKRQKCLDPAAS